MKRNGRSRVPSPANGDRNGRVARFRRAIEDATSTDDLLALQREHGPIDEDDPDAEELCYALCAAACCLAGGPPPARDRYTLIRPAPSDARVAYRLRGIIGQRIATVIWADGRLYGSRYAAARLEPLLNGTVAAASALDRIRSGFRSVSEGPTRLT